MKSHIQLTQNSLRTGRRLLPWPGRKEIDYQDIEQIIIDQNKDGLKTTVNLSLKSGETFPLNFLSPEEAASFKEELEEILWPHILKLDQPLPFEKIRRTCGELAASKGQNIRKWMDFVIHQAICHDASDIHLESRDHRLFVQFRIDGVLFPILDVDSQLGDRALNCIKSAAGLLVYRRDTIQEGRISLSTGDEIQDVRVSILPSISGEKAALRLYDKLKGASSLEDLGFSDSIGEELKRIMTASKGLFVISGPSGSGKTTTLYALLRQIKERVGHLANVMTLEDPVEYRLPGITQVQIDSRAGVSFARGLRSLLRQDVSVIMVGEIRDAETAQAAVEAALTGHLVLSSLHAGSSAESVTRLLDMGIAPYQLQSALSGVLCQRLARKLCPDCRQEVSARKEDWSLWQEPDIRQILPDKFYQGTGCAQCRETGYRGRTALAEFLCSRGTVRDLIKNFSDSRSLEKASIAQGMTPLHRRGLEMIVQAETDLREIRRVIG